MKINLPLSHLAILLGLSLLPCAGQARAQNTPVPTETGTDNQNNTDPPQGDPGQQQSDEDANSNSQNSSSPTSPTFPAPFDLQWGEGPEQILKWASSRQFQTAWKENAQAQGAESLLEVTPPAGTDQFPDAEFNTLNFAFKSGHLVEVKVIFRYRDQTPAQSQALTENRKGLVEKGQNKAANLISNDQKDKNGVHYTRQLWQWEKGPGLYIYLIEAEARQKQKSITSIALSYRNQTLAGTLPNQSR